MTTSNDENFVKMTTYSYKRSGIVTVPPFAIPRTTDSYGTNIIATGDNIFITICHPMVVYELGCLEKGIAEALDECCGLLPLGVSHVYT